MHIDKHPKKSVPANLSALSEYLATRRRNPERSKPLIHCITNPLAIQFTADAILALGARPIMVELASEVTNVVRDADALLLNLGNLTEGRIAGLKKAAAVAHSEGVPIVLDPVGVGGMPSRLQLAYDMIHLAEPTIIKGNSSEIQALANNTKTATGVDGRPLSIEERKRSATAVQNRTGAVVITTGASDLVTSAAGHITIEGGSTFMSTITGSGCLLGGLLAAVLGLVKETDYTTKTVAALTTEMLMLAATKAERKLTPYDGSGSFRVYLLDQLYQFGTAGPAWDKTDWKGIFNHEKES
ncbi:MAG: hydroxyethylthiazole kinase [Fastidiosipilaceae bacterium]|jgi:hydroxyethylthiazole kinase|nr:hydroxyethylthiazole kinase [Clostridiaceae bacterium]